MLLDLKERYRIIHFTYAVIYTVCIGHTSIPVELPPNYRIWCLPKHTTDWEIYKLLWWMKIASAIFYHKVVGLETVLHLFVLYLRNLKGFLCDLQLLIIILIWNPFGHHLCSILLWQISVASKCLCLLYRRIYIYISFKIVLLENLQKLLHVTMAWRLHGRVLYMRPKGRKSKWPN